MTKHWEIIAHEYVGSFFPLMTMSDAFFNEINKITGQRIRHAFKIENQVIEHIIVSSDWKRALQVLVLCIKNNPSILRSYYIVLEKLAKLQIKQVASYKKYISKATNRELNKYYQDYCKSNRKVYAYGLLLPLLDYQDYTFLTDELTQILEARQAIKYFGLLTTPLRSTFIKQQELALLVILREIKKNKKLIKKIVSAISEDELRKIMAKHPSIWKLLQRHKNRYSWTTYVYEGPAADINYFLSSLRDLLIRGINPDRELRLYLTERANVRQKQKQIIRTLRLSDYERKILVLTRDAVFIKPYRRELQSHSYYLMEPVLKEIAQRLNISLRQVRMMLPEEVAKGLLYQKVNFNLLNERLKLSMYGWHQGKRFCLSSNAVNSFFSKKVKKVVKPKLPSHITGSIAFSGLARGAVRIINMPTDMAKMKSGDILVSDATAPNLMPVIRLAAAIVTNEGGLTCHAAIVSRELKIPCVIGTKIATQVLKDGDRVEVDANKGIIRKL